MKRFLLLFVFAAWFSNAANASKNSNHALLAHIGAALIGNFELSYEQRLKKNFSLSVSAIHYNSKAAWRRIFCDGYLIALGISPKFHVYGKAHRNSFYLSPSLRAGYLRRFGKNDHSILSRLGAGFGYQHVFKFGLMMDLNAGIEHYYQFNPIQDPPYSLRPYYSLALGYSF